MGRNRSFVVPSCRDRKDKKERPFSSCIKLPLLSPAAASLSSVLQSLVHKVPGVFAPFSLSLIPNSCNWLVVCLSLFSISGQTTEGSSGLSFPGILGLGSSEIFASYSPNHRWIPKLGESFILFSVIILAAQSLFTFRCGRAAMMTREKRKGTDSVFTAVPVKKGK